MLHRYHKCLQNGALTDFFGITKDPTSCYMFVMRYYENGDLYSYLEESMGILCWRDIIDILWSISTGLRPSDIDGTPPVYYSLMLQCLDANPLKRPTASQICECLGNWVSAVNDDPHPSDLSNQFDTAEEIKFKNIGKLELNKISYHEKAIYISRPLDSINIGSSESK
ncbi:unnamed protein product [Rhizophagus irregularis]|nr:unnamed protein product [Rhizophagus irregularis]